jgi:hypothetical protein
VSTVTANWLCELEEMTRSEPIYKKFETFCKEVLEKRAAKWTEDFRNPVRIRRLAVTCLKPEGDSTCSHRRLTLSEQLMTDARANWALKLNFLWAETRKGRVEGAPVTLETDSGKYYGIQNRGKSRELGEACIKT